jgi:hypothetical protein
MFFFSTSGCDSVFQTATAEEGSAGVSAWILALLFPCFSRAEVFFGAG